MMLLKHIRQRVFWPSFSWMYLMWFNKIVSFDSKKIALWILWISFENSPRGYRKWDIWVFPSRTPASSSHNQQIMLIHKMHADVFIFIQAHIISCLNSKAMMLTANVKSDFARSAPCNIGCNAHVVTGVQILCFLDLQLSPMDINNEKFWRS